MILNRIENFYSENGYKVSYLFDQCSILLASTFLHRVRIPTLLKTYYPSFLRNIRNKDSPQPLLKWTYYRHKKKFLIYYPSTSINLKKERKKNIQLTCSTLANTLSKLRPANFLISSSVHVGSSSSVANNWGYLETSSNPVGVLENARIDNPPTPALSISNFVLFREHREKERCRVSTTIKLNSSLGINFTIYAYISIAIVRTPCIRARYPLDCNCFVEVSSIDNDYSLNSALRYSKR